ncbi:PDR/VanB family oxidoreductase [Verminephrobacter eiseniae]|uniref:PDR/VanB family oxidoreductase n=1 Tax=Verminephrobacter eiseniae TaxID=364317 RepID=UPI0022377AB9|nr:PDR/VanB family oxidoreductase [Verminephrobacter eiseniae]MCW5237475.1 oxidoreductase [Verminephrobacter eiseniae]
MNYHDEWMQVEVRRIRDLTPTVREFELVYPERQVAAPGSHVNVRVTIDGQPDKRSYSVVSGSEDGIVTIAVKLLPESRGGSRFMWTLEPRMRLHATKPHSDFALSRGAPHYLLLAGGIGVTPVVAIARALNQLGASVRMLYAARSRNELAYAEELGNILGERVAVFPADEGKMVDIAAEVAALPADGELYMCGPIGLLDAVRQEWALQKRPRSKLRFETFGSSGHHAATSFLVKIPRLNLEVVVAEDRSMLDALTSAGVEVLSECRRGECGLCAIDVLSVDGEIDHRDVFFSGEQRAQNKKVCACVSRVAGGTIVIEPAFRGDPDFGRIEILSDRGLKQCVHPSHLP